MDKFRWWKSLNKQWQIIFNDAIGINRDPTEEDLDRILQLKRLDCSYRQINTIQPLLALTDLTWLDCSNNPLSKKQLISLCRLKKLQYLNCRNLIEGEEHNHEPEVEVDQIKKWLDSNKLRAFKANRRG